MLQTRKEDCFARAPVTQNATLEPSAATGMATLQPPADTTGFRATLEDKLAALLGAGFRSRTSRLEKKRAVWETQQQEQQQDGGSRRWRGAFLHLSDEKGALQVNVRFSIVKRSPSLSWQYLPPLFPSIPARDLSTSITIPLYAYRVYFSRLKAEKEPASGHGGRNGSATCLLEPEQEPGYCNMIYWIK